VGSLGSAKVKNGVAAGHLKKLITRDLGSFTLGYTEDNLTHRQWYDTLEAIAESLYWQRIPRTKHCTHILEEEFPAGFWLGGTSSVNSALRVSRSNCLLDANQSSSCAELQLVCRRTRNKKNAQEEEEL
jgi:hypothetical protein